MNENDGMGALATVERSEIVEADIVPNFGITLEEARYRVQQLQTFVREQMREGEDFGIIPGTKKPSLWKSGAEKLNMIFGLAPHVEIIDKHVCYGNGEEKPFFAYEVKVQLLNKRDGRIEAEGVGACNSGEKKYRSQNALDMANTILKMAKKRALVDATLSATRASGIFTQDTEDMPAQARGDGQRAMGGGQTPQRQTPQRQTPQRQTQQRQQPRAQPQPQYEELGDVAGADLDWLIECRDWILCAAPGHPQRQEVLDEIARQQEANRARVSAPAGASDNPAHRPNRAADVARAVKNGIVEGVLADEASEENDEHDPFADDDR